MNLLNRRQIVSALSVIPGIGIFVKPARAASTYVGTHYEGLLRMFNLGLEMVSKAELDNFQHLGKLKKVEICILATYESGVHIGSSPVYDVENPDFRTEAREIIL